MITPTKAYFLVKISKKAQRERLEKTGIFYNPSNVYMTRNMQSGEIVAIGTKACEVFPEAKIGETLIFHHFVEGDAESRKDSLIFEDELYNYYVISAYEQNGKATEVYGVWNGEKLTPHPEFLFLEKAKPHAHDLPNDEFINQAMEMHGDKDKGGFFIFKEYKNTREDNTQKLSRLKAEIQNLSKMQLNDNIKIAIEEKEKECEMIGREMNKRTYLPYTIAAANKILSEWFDMPVTKGDIIYCMNMACQTEIEFMDKTYLICKSNYIGFMLSNN